MKQNAAKGADQEVQQRNSCMAILCLPVQGPTDDLRKCGHRQHEEEPLDYTAVLCEIFAGIDSQSGVHVVDLGERFNF